MGPWHIVDDIKGMMTGGMVQVVERNTGGDSLGDECLERGVELRPIRPREKSGPSARTALRRYRTIVLPVRQGVREDLFDSHHNEAMDVGRFCRAIDGKGLASHQRIAEYVKPLCDRYYGLGFTPREEWVMEQTMQALRTLLADVQCSDEERRTIEQFLSLATEDIPDAP